MEMPLSCYPYRLNILTTIGIDPQTRISYISVMTEITDIKKIEDMPEAVRRFILHWGDMGSTWGVNRTVAQIHALLYITERPLNADEISSCLGVARSNVSNSLKELLQIKTISRVPLPGDRRDYFTADTDVWAVAKKIAAVRKAREIDPALETLNFCVDAAKNDASVSTGQAERLIAMQSFTASMDRWYNQVADLPPNTLSRLIAMGDRVVSFLNIGRKSGPS